MKLSVSLFLAFPLIALVATSCTKSDSSPPAKSASAPLTAAVTPKNLSLKNACALAVSHHSSLATYPMDRRAADARILRASRIPNPTLTIDDEDFFGSGDLGGLSSSVLNTLLTQVIERGGKRQARTDAARSSGKVMDAEYEVRRLEVIKKTGELYLDAVAARENVRFLEAKLNRSKETQGVISQLSEVGRVTIDAVQQAKLEVQKSGLELAKARTDEERAARALTAQWGDPRATLVTNQSLHEPPATLASRTSQKKGLKKHPTMQHSLAKVAESDALLKLAKANKLINPTLGGGVRHANEADQFSGLFSISFPLPVFNKREDAIAEMSALSEKSRTELAGAQRALDAEFSLAWADLVSAHQTARLIKIDLLPSSAELFKSAEESFRVGKITSLEYLAAQQQFQEIRRKWLDARLDYQTMATRVQVLTNRSL